MYFTHICIPGIFVEDSRGIELSLPDFQIPCVFITLWLPLKTLVVQNIVVISQYMYNEREMTNG